MTKGELTIIANARVDLFHKRIDPAIKKLTALLRKNGHQKKDACTCEMHDRVYYGCRCGTEKQPNANDQFDQRVKT